MVWLAGFLLSVLIRMPYTMQNRQNTITDSHNDRAETIVLTAMFATMMVLPLLYLVAPVMNFADYQLPLWASILGALLQLPYLWLFWRSHADLGRNWSPGLELREQHTLVTTGIYRKIRHPMYSAIWVAAFSQGLLLQNGIAGLLVIPAFAAMCILRIPKEEAMMVQQFGTEYTDYQARAGRLLPWF
ncbi:MAG: isoprenylcysteine carboxyl methyltransferase [Rhodobacterales bacterium]|nr:MAG: isoprenylcysteine carboxyl methyltransferase [Rhodobacterales bacterium]